MLKESLLFAAFIILIITTSCATIDNYESVQNPFIDVYMRIAGPKYDEILSISNEGAVSNKILDKTGNILVRGDGTLNKKQMKELIEYLMQSNLIFYDSSSASSRSSGNSKYIELNILIGDQVSTIASYYVKELLPLELSKITLKLESYKELINYDDKIEFDRLKGENKLCLLYYNKNTHEEKCYKEDEQPQGWNYSTEQSGGKIYTYCFRSESGECFTGREIFTGGEILDQ